MGKKNKPQKAEAAPPPAEALEIPLSAAPLPLLRLDARGLGELLELCFADQRLLALCGELKLYSPGYRLEAMPPDQVARMLADEVNAAKDALALVDKAIRESLRNPVFEGQPLTADQYRDLLELFTGDPLQHLARLAWRALIDDDEKLREYALTAIELGIEALDAPARNAKPRKPQLPAEVQELRKLVEEANREAERKGLERDSLREQLASARAEMVLREKTLGEVRDELVNVRAELGRASSELSRLTAAGEGRALSDARRLADENRSLSEKMRAAQEERDALRTQVHDLTRRAAEAPSPAPAAGPQEIELVSAEEAATFLIPIFTREFYDSIQRWDRRLQRAAFDKVSLLARDWRHGSLRALALEGLPGYYRIRIATDVRLIYRRGEGNQLEILSLIDREDLDRYIRQARTR